MRAAVVLRYYADLSVDEVATTLGKSPNTIKAQLQTALDRLRAHLADPTRHQPRGGQPCMTTGSRTSLRGALHAEADEPAVHASRSGSSSDGWPSAGDVTDAARRQRTLAAAVAAIAITGGGAMFFLFATGPTGLVGTTPVPSATASAATPLPDAATLLADFPTTTLLLEHAVDGGPRGTDRDGRRRAIDRSRLRWSSHPCATVPAT